jgi:hypothetical protein
MKCTHRTIEVMQILMICTYNYIWSTYTHNKVRGKYCIIYMCIIWSILCMQHVVGHPCVRFDPLLALNDNNKAIFNFSILLFRSLLSCIFTFSFTLPKTIILVYFSLFSDKGIFNRVGPWKRVVDQDQGGQIQSPSRGTCWQRPNMMKEPSRSIKIFVDNKQRNQRW